MTSMMSKLAASAALVTVITGAALAETTLIHAGHVLAEPGEGYGKEKFSVLTSDLSEDYVLINSDYRS